MYRQIWQQGPAEFAKMDILFTNHKSPSIHSESVPRTSRSKASTYSYAEKGHLAQDKDSSSNGSSWRSRSVSHISHVILVDSYCRMVRETNQREKSGEGENINNFNPRGPTVYITQSAIVNIYRGIFWIIISSLFNSNIFIGLEKFSKKS